jgi:hypothetical protein
MSGDSAVSESWLALREPADAAARSNDLVGELRRRLPASGPAEPLVIHDLGAGTGAMGRWLAPLLPGPQRWVEHDRDPGLLAVAAARPPARAADGSEVAVEVRHDDITRLEPGALSGATAIVASALLDMLTADELDRLIAGCAAAGCPILLAMSVAGRANLSPADPLDRPIAAAFDDHQRRTTGRGPLLGPDAVAAAAAELDRLGADVLVRPSPWRLGAPDAELAAAWLAGWVDAACEQRTELAAGAAAYRSRRLAEARAGRLTVAVAHADILALPGDRPQPATKRGESA